MKTLLFTLLLALGSATMALAGDGDFRTGTYTGMWGGYRCSYEVTSRAKNKAVYYGKIHLAGTEQYDSITIEQFSDNSLAMTRKLTGAETGKTQWVQTSPPSVQKSRIVFAARARGGPGMQKTMLAHSHLYMPR